MMIADHQQMHSVYYTPTQRQGGLKLKGSSTKQPIIEAEKDIVVDDDCRSPAAG